MLIRLGVLAKTVDPKNSTFQAQGPAHEMPEAELDRVVGELEGGAVTRFYRGGDPQGWIIGARRTEEGLWVNIRISSQAAEAWKLVENGAVSTIEIQPLSKGVDVFLKSVAATYPAPII
jgi:hypothetical protein